MLQLILTALQVSTLATTIAAMNNLISILKLHNAYLILIFNVRKPQSQLNVRPVYKQPTKQTPSKPYFYKSTYQIAQTLQHFTNNFTYILVSKQHLSLELRITWLPKKRMPIAYRWQMDPALAAKTVSTYKTIVTSAVQMKKLSSLVLEQLATAQR